MTENTPWRNEDGSQRSRGGMSPDDHKDALRAVYGGAYRGERHTPGWTGKGRRMGTDERRPDPHVGSGRRRPIEE